MTDTETVKIPRGQVRRVAIIGGGASGAVTLDAFIKERAFDEIHLFERRSVAGGVWVLDEHIDQKQIVGRVAPGAKPEVLDPPLPIPVLQEGQSLVKTPSSQFRFRETPSYEGIRTNIPEVFMTYSDRPRWSHLDQPEVDTLTTRDVVQSYVADYINKNEGDKTHEIFYNTTVEKLTKKGLKYELDIRTEVPGSDFETWKKSTYDAVVVATGHYSIPKIPDVPGLQKVYERFPEKLEHAKFYRNLDKYHNKKVLLIGSRASGVDLGHQISKVSSQVTVSTRSLERSILQPTPSSLFQIKPIIERYSVVEDRITAHFSDGTVLEDPDYIIYGTGYYFSYPFLKQQYPDFVAQPSNEYLPFSFQHTFYVHDPLIATVGVPIDSISFRAFEYQAVLISRFYSGKAELPSLQDQLRWCLARVIKVSGERPDSIERGVHTIGIVEAVSYRDELTALGGGVSPIGSGKAFPVFGEAETTEIIKFVLLKGKEVPEEIQQRAKSFAPVPVNVSISV
ncbi:hypothetical protein BABINDRAFT_162476 [Babjeviella inositovora NRRL Y-12698]|uniref:FAD/NAD(P)-binding domain-containing protein n=1 Tax=Babjeviella inositovora NRRL Y-12698 TaxID=984486 RepID=A0A1E3QM72_9ASCO|nr:uncharacterized protein BABINDRAFT_162476 [Babjeviella inositovora NRRL Y-12698]ODQ78796.1 hypothetical protein BABINDRAFT_162476 [Babjeviella inositovora NRRL Y-12698]